MKKPDLPRVASGAKVEGHTDGVGTVKPDVPKFQNPLSDNIQLNLRDNLKILEQVCTLRALRLLVSDYESRHRLCCVFLIHIHGTARYEIVAQLDRASDCGSEGQRFKSSRSQ